MVPPNNCSVVDRLRAATLLAAWANAGGEACGGGGGGGVGDLGELNNAPMSHLHLIVGAKEGGHLRPADRKAREAEKCEADDGEDVAHPLISMERRRLNWRKDK